MSLLPPTKTQYFGVPQCRICNTANGLTLDGDDFVCRVTDDCIWREGLSLLSEGRREARMTPERYTRYREIRNDKLEIVRVTERSSGGFREPRV